MPSDQMPTPESQNERILTQPLLVEQMAELNSRLTRMCKILSATEETSASAYKILPEGLHKLWDILEKLHVILRELEAVTGNPILKDNRSLSHHAKIKVKNPK